MFPVEQIPLERLLIMILRNLNDAIRTISIESLCLLLSRIFPPYSVWFPLRVFQLAVCRHLVAQPLRCTGVRCCNAAAARSKYSPRRGCPYDSTPQRNGPTSRWMCRSDGPGDASQRRIGGRYVILKHQYEKCWTKQVQPTPPIGFCISLSLYWNIFIHI